MYLNGKFKVEGTRVGPHPPPRMTPSQPGSLAVEKSVPPMCGWSLINTSASFPALNMQHDDQFIIMMIVIIIRHGMTVLRSLLSYGERSTS
jgi:hypothetical protein